MAGEEAFTGAVAGGTTIGAMKLLGTYGPKWAATLAKIELAGTLAKPAAGAAAIWLLAQPGDDQAITAAFNDWRTINTKLTYLRIQEWGKTIQAVQAAWPEGEDRKAFDRFMGIVFQEVQQLESAAARMADAVQDAQSEIHKIVNNAGLIVDSLLGIIIASEIVQLIGKQMMATGVPPVVAQGATLVAAAKATQESSGLLLMGATVNAIAGATVAVILSMGNLTALMGADNQFPLPQANLDSDGTDGKTDFDDIVRKSATRSPGEGWSYT